MCLFGENVNNPPFGVWIGWIHCNDFFFFPSSFLSAYMLCWQYALHVVWCDCFYALFLPLPFLLFPTNAPIPPQHWWLSLLNKTRFWISNWPCCCTAGKNIHPEVGKTVGKCLFNIFISKQKYFRLDTNITSKFSLHYVFWLLMFWSKSVIVRQLGLLNCTDGRHYTDDFYQCHFHHSGLNNFPS